MLLPLGMLRSKAALCLAVALALMAAGTGRGLGQAQPTAARAGDLQVGGGFTSANGDYRYAGARLRGLMFYGDFDFRRGIGVELEFHQLDDPTSDVYQRTYEAGGRYAHAFGRWTPYAKGLYGRGVLNFPKNDANLAYNLLAAGAGVDLAATERINVRADFEAQYWLSTPGAGLHIAPTLITVGVAYHFGAGTAR